MAHELCIRGGKVHMMYAGEEPWHGLGTKLESPATSAEAMKAAHLDWKVRKVPLWAADCSNRLQVPDAHALVRADLWDKEDKDCPIFGIVSNAYTPIQNSEAFAFIDSIIGEGAAAYHTAGALGNGERVWMLVKLPGHLDVINDDVAHKYLLLANDHRGEGAVQVKFTPIRVVCNNTLTWAMEGGALIRVSHWRNAKERLEAAKENLGIIEKQFATLGESYKAMLKVSLNEQRLAEYLGAVFPEPENANEKRRRRVATDRALAEHFFDQGRGNQASGVRGTLWAAYNGVTELIDHREPPFLKGQRRLQYVWFGGGASIKARAYSLALDLVAGKPLPSAVKPQPDRSKPKGGLFNWRRWQGN